MQSPPACYRLLRAVPSLTPNTRLRGSIQGHAEQHQRVPNGPGCRAPVGAGARTQLTAPTPGVRHALHRESAPTEQLNDKVLDLALEPPQLLYPQTHIPPAGTSNRLGRLGLQRRVGAAHP